MTGCAAQQHRSTLMQWYFNYNKSGRQMFQYCHACPIQSINDIQGLSNSFRNLAPNPPVKKGKTAEQSDVEWIPQGQIWSLTTLLAENLIRSSQLSVTNPL